MIFMKPYRLKALLIGEGSFLVAGILKGKGLIFSPDFIALKDTFTIVKQCQEFFCAIKIGNIYLYKEGINVIKKFKDSFNLPIICDFKLMDIPDIAEEIISIGIENGMDGAMIWGLAGEETVYRCVSSFPGIMIFVLTEYTHSSEAISPDIGDEMAKMAVEFGTYGIQAPATRPERIKKLRKIIGKEKKIISCGVGYQGAPYGSAVKHGADFEIVGRSICQATDPIGESEKALKAILSY